jgi:hypothetical protein
MASNPEVSVVLSDMMWYHLRRQAGGLGVPIELLVAGLVCDTMESFTNGPRPKVQEHPRVTNPAWSSPSRRYC